MEKSLLDKYPVDKRLYKAEDSTYEDWTNNSCIFGIRHHNDPLPFVDMIPTQITGMYTYFGEGNLEVLKSLIKNGTNESLEHLIIGFEHGNAKFGYKDYSRISDLLSITKFPKLKTFTFGYDFLIVNEDAYYPFLGDVTNVLKNMPALESLELCGVFELKDKLNLKKLKEIGLSSYWVTDENVGVVSQRTLDNFLESNFESLEILEIDLNGFSSYVSEIKYYYELDENLFLNFQALKSLYVCGYFKQGTIDRLSKSLLGKIPKLSLEDMRE